MAQVIGPVNSTANYADNVLEGVWSSGFLFAQAQPILIEITYGVALGASGDIIHDLICPAAQSVNIIAPTSPHFPNITINRVRFKSQGSQPATVSGYFNEARAPGIIAGVSGGPLGGQALLNLSAFNVTIATPTLLVGLPTFQLPTQFGGFWLGTTGQTGHIDVLVQTQSGTTPIGGIVSGDRYGFSGGNAGQYAVPSLGPTVTLTVTSQNTQAINLTAVPILSWPPPQFDPPQANALVFQSSVAIGGGGSNNYILPPYDGDALLMFTNLGAAVMNCVIYELDYSGTIVAIPLLEAVAAGVSLNLPIKLPHRILQATVTGTATQTFDLSIVATPRRGGS